MKVYRKNTHTGCYISCKSNICHVWKGVQFTAITIGLPPNTKNDKICLMSLVA
jgi:hypothetical protein